VEYVVPNAWLKDKRDTGKSGYGFFEQFQPLTAQFCVKVCEAGNVATGTGKAFN
jgi:hypothetical protein